MSKISALLLGIIICSTLSLQPVFTQSGNRSVIAAVDKAEAERWREDLRYLASELPKRHKNLFHSMTREQFDAAVKRLDERIPTLARHQVRAEFARLVALVGDGHTNIGGTHDPKEDIRTYPLTLFVFKDGLFVQMADREHASAIGARVVRIGNASAEQALKTVGELVYHDNEMGIKAFAPLLLVTPEVLHAVGLVDDMERATYVVERAGQQTTLQLSPAPRLVERRGHWDLARPQGWVDLRDAAKSPLPLYLKDPQNLFWFEYLEDSKTVYVQYNGVSNKENETVADFAKRLFAFVDSHPVERLVLDMRFNGGGNNYLNKPLLLGLIKSKVDQPGKLFTIIGRRTFSAAQNLVNELEKYTNTIFVGEPTGENVNFYGDPARITLPNSGLVVRASTLWWQNMDPRDRRIWTGPHIAAELTSDDYRNNVDPALKAILGYSPKRELTETLSEALTANDVPLARKRFQEFLADPANAYVNVEDKMNTFGYTLLASNRVEHAVEIFKLNVEAYPQSANVYDSLGEAYLKQGNKELAARNYEKAYELDPSNTNAAQVVKTLRQK